MEGLDAPDGSPSGGAHGGVFEHSEPLGIGGAEPGRSGGAFGGERADVPALDAPLRGRRRVRACRSAARQSVGTPGSGRPGRGGGAALSRALSGLHRQALPRASGEGSRLRLGLHLDQASSPVDGGGGEGAAQGGSSKEAGAAAVAWHDAASGRLAARMARRPAGARSDRDAGRRHERHSLGLSGRGGGRMLRIRSQKARLRRSGPWRTCLAAMACP